MIRVIRPHLHCQCFDQIGFEDVADRNPVQKALQSLQSDIQQSRILRVCENVITQLVDERELPVKILLHRLSLLRRHVFASMLEDFLADYTPQTNTST